MKLLIRLLVIKLILAAWFYAQPAYGDPGVGLGVIQGNGGNQYNLEIGDFSHFNQKEKTFGLYRYGFGRGTLEIGNGIGLNLSSDGGFTLWGLYNNGDGIMPQLGVDIGGRIHVNSNPAVKSYYQWLPALTWGPQFRLEGVNILVVGKAGAAIGTYDKLGILPDASGLIGAALYSNTPLVDLGFSYSEFGDSRLISFDTVYRHDKLSLGLRIESLGNELKNLREVSASALIKMPL